MIFRGEGYSPAPEPAVKRQRQADFNGELALTGFGLSSGQIKPGETLEVTLDWQALDEAGPAYTAFLHLVTPDGNRQPRGRADPARRLSARPVAQGPDAARPAPAGVAADLPPGHYRLDLGLYYPARPTTHWRLLGKGAPGSR